MTFPYDRSVQGSLFKNIALSLSPLPLEARPQLTQLFNKVFELCSEINLLSGTAREMRNCATLLQPTALSPQENNTLKKLIEQSLKIKSLTGKNLSSN